MAGMPGRMLQLIFAGSVLASHVPRVRQANSNASGLYPLHDCLYCYIGHCGPCNRLSCCPQAHTVAPYSQQHTAGLSAAGWAGPARVLSPKLLPLSRLDKLGTAAILLLSVPIPSLHYGVCVHSNAQASCKLATLGSPQLRMQQPGTCANPPTQLAARLVVVIIALVIEHVGQTILQYTYEGG
jgi:hypothetical protein